MPEPEERPYYYRRDVNAGCFVCNGDRFMWTGPNAQGVAARHFDATGHRTWVEVHMTIYYGHPEAAIPPGGFGT